MYKGKLVVVNILTTGLDIYYDEIIEFAALIIEEGQVTNSVDYIFKVNKNITKRILNEAGISDNEISAAEPIDVYRQEIITLLEDAVFVGHDFSIALAILERTLGIPISNPVWDTQELVRIFFPTTSQHHLMQCAKALNFDIPKHKHSTLFKAYITWNILEASWKKALEMDLSFYNRTLNLTEGTLIGHFFQTIAKIISRKFPERLISTEVLNLNNEDGLFKVTDEIPPPEELDWVEKCFAPGGTLEKNLPGYESRTGQAKMAKAVADALISSERLIVEAGTGTGKSYAYLIPSLWWARKTEKKVVVATHTIPLQEQLHKKDIPVLNEVLPFTFKGALLKGKGNYLCLKKWLAIQKHTEDLNKDEKLALISVMIWLRETISGDWQEISQIPGLARIWVDINAEDDNCIPSRCRYANQCFMLRARNQAAEADVLIVNHSLLLSNIKADNKVLPEYDGLIVDEAHHLHKAALEQLGDELSYELITKNVELIQRSIITSTHNPKTSVTYLRNGMSLEAWEKYQELSGHITGVCAQIMDQAKEIFNLLHQIIGKEKSLRLTQKHKTLNWWDTFEIQLENLKGRIENGIDILKSKQNLLTETDTEEGEGLLIEISNRLRDLEQFRETISLVLKVDDPSRVVWLEKNNNRLSLKTSPVDVSGVLRRQLFNKVDSAILTSATISIAGSFNHFLSEVGLSSTTRTLIVESPFDFEQQMQFIIVKDLLTTKSLDLLNLQEIATFISEVSRKMQGRTLVLSTSHSFLKEISNPLNNLLENHGLKLLTQKIAGSRKAILEEFMENPNSVLLGADSFWEGINLPGDKLLCVILIKLPFWPPTMPLIEARSEYLEQNGKNPFYEFLLPEAVLRFKQGFGRLIRSKSDRGLVILCDSRVIEKSYGRVFLSSLPLSTHIRLSKTQINDQIDRWFEDQTNEEVLF